MNKRWKIILMVIPLITILIILSIKFWAQEECTEYQGTFTEAFDTITYKDEENSSVAHWGEGYITLNRLGADFNVANPVDIPAWINTLTTNDFDGDGWPDFIGSSSSYSNVLAFVKNMGVDEQIGSFVITHWIDGSEGTGGWPTKGVGGASIDTNGHCGMTSGDYDGDGDYDFLFMSSANNDPFTPERIWLYENHLNEGDLYFTQTDLTGNWSNKIKGIAWSATMMQSIDFDGDGDIDILVGNRAGEVLLYKNTNNGQVNDGTFPSSPAVLIDTGWDPRGVSTLSVADFDGDGDLDIIVGSVTYAELKYYKNDGTDNFTLYKEYYDPDGDIYDDQYDGGATASIVGDFDQDGDVDLMIGTDQWNIGDNDLGGVCFYFKNIGGEFVSRLIFDDRPTTYDFDLGASFDYDQDGDLDFIMADGNHTEFYYIFTNEVADVYTLTGIAQSISLTSDLDPQQYAITKVKIADLDQGWEGTYSSDGLKIEYYVSNNGGKDWEFYVEFEGNELQDYTDLPEHTFVHYGTDLRWKAELSALEDDMAEWEDASFETPRMDQIRFEYTYVDRREYSRTSVVATKAEIDGEDKKLIIGGTFIFPGWEGHLRAYNVTNMVPEDNSYSILRTVSRSEVTSPSGRWVASGVEILWDAGELLDSRTADSRSIYTAIDEGSLIRYDFSVDYVDILGPILQDVNNDNEGLINFIRGEGRDWKLGDINHSNPIVVGPPEGNPNIMGEGYSEFKETWADRDKLIYVGANDGMLHCFDVRTGEELWAFIPYNLLPKLRNMWAVDPDTGERYFNRDVYVDGSPVAADVYINGEWRTVLICGQGPGKGSIIGGGLYYYFALDITDPDSPEPLWEFTDDTTMGETWSVSAIGKITKEGDGIWAAFMGSGYDNDDDPSTTLGNVFYAVDLETGTAFWTFTADDIDTSENFPNILNAIPGSPSIIDIERDGKADRVYVGDLDGRVWKIDVSVEFKEIGKSGKTTWDDVVTAIYEDDDNYPIISKPTAWVDYYSGSTNPHIYFGTGGDDRAPNDAYYSFIALIDNDASDQEERMEWYLGDPGILNLSSEKDVGDLGQGEKVWADPKVANSIVYFNTITGSIESVDPCENLAGVGKLYGRYVRAVRGAAVGGTAFTTASGSVESLTLASKTRSAVTLGERTRTTSGTRKREVYVQEYDSTIQRLEQPIGAILKVKSWREIFKIIR
ncbi:MAG: PilC/PilY family type IV pilus protein [Candidatus Aminicenantia bacterium]